MGLILVARATNVISERFPWLLLGKSHETRLVLQCIKMVVCRTAFFPKSHFLKAVEISQKMSFKETLILIIVIIIITVVHLSTVDKKSFKLFRQKKLIKKKKGKIIYLYKSGNVDFFVMFEILSKLQELICGKVK